MLQYDLTETPLFGCESRAQLPTEAEMFVLTVALLLIRDAAYTDFAGIELRVAEEDISALAECIEYRVSPFTRDFGDAEHLRDRLRSFVGLRISAMLPVAGWCSEEPT